MPNVGNETEAVLTTARLAETALEEMVARSADTGDILSGGYAVNGMMGDQLTPMLQKAGTEIPAEALGTQARAQEGIIDNITQTANLTDGHSDDAGSLVGGLDFTAVRG